jgi:flagellar protein FlaF
VNAIDRARSAYDPASNVIRTPSSIELEAFARVTRKLRDAQRSGTSIVDVVTALHENRLLWNAIAADVADGGNQLPKDLRARLFYLAEFTIAHSRKVADRTATVDALIDLNTSIMQGLRMQSTGT